MRILVTGGTGYLGRKVVRDLMKEHEVTVLTRREFHSKFETARGNIRNFRDVRAAVKGMDAVVNLAVESNHSKSWREHFRTTVLGTRNVLKASVGEAGRVVHMGIVAAGAKSQTSYVKAKVAAEKVAKEYWDFLRVPILKPSFVYDGSRVRAAAKAARFPIPRVPMRFRPIYWGKLSECIKAALDRGESRTYQVGDSKVIKFTDFLKAAAYPRGVIFLPSFLAKPARLSARARFFLEDKVFDNEMKELGIRPVDTVKKIFQIKFGSEWKERLKGL